MFTTLLSDHWLVLIFVYTAHTSDNLMSTSTFAIDNGGAVPIQGQQDLLFKLLANSMASSLIIQGSIETTTCWLRDVTALMFDFQSQCMFILYKAVIKIDVSSYKFIYNLEHLL